MGQAFGMHDTRLRYQTPYLIISSTPQCSVRILSVAAPGYDLHMTGPTKGVIQSCQYHDFYTLTEGHTADVIIFR